MQKEGKDAPNKKPVDVDLDSLNKEKVYLRWSLGGLVGAIIALITVVIWVNNLYHSLKQNNLLTEQKLVMVVEQLNQIKENLPPQDEQLNLKNCVKLLQTDIIANKDIYEMFLNLDDTNR